MDQLRTWRDVLSKHSEENGHPSPSTIAVSPVLHAPQFYWHPLNKIKPHFGYINYKAKMDELEVEILQFNRENNTSGMVHLQTMGDRGLPGLGSITRWSLWREYNWDPRGGVLDNPASVTDPTLPRDNRRYTSCLHLTDPLRVNSYFKVLKYFYKDT